MGKLRAAARKRMPAKSFALPGKRYPIHDKSHARAALSMVGRHGSPSEKSRVRAAVERRFPSLKRDKG